MENHKDGSPFVIKLITTYHYIISRMKNIYILLLSIILFFSCSYKEQNKNVSKSNCQYVSTPSKQAKNEKEPIVFDKCPPTVADISSFMQKGTPQSFKELHERFLYADLYFEELIYALVAVDKFEISNGYRHLADCLTNAFTYLTISDHSKEMAKHYLMIGARKKASIAKLYESFDKRKDYKEMWLPESSNYNDSVVIFKRKTLQGNSTEYERLKRTLFSTGQHEILLYYSFIMADKYHYTPAKKDVIYIIDKTYRDYKLGKLGKNAEYFCSFFQ